MRKSALHIGRLLMAAVLLATATTARAYDYNLYICGVQVTSNNINNLSSIDGVKNGTITFDGKTLTLSNVTIDATGKQAQGMTVGVPGLTVKLVGQNEVKSNYAGMKVADDVTIEGSGSITLRGSDNPNYQGYGILFSAAATFTVAGGADVTAQGYYGGYYGYVDKYTTCRFCIKDIGTKFAAKAEARGAFRAQTFTWEGCLLVTKPEKYTYWTEDDGFLGYIKSVSDDAVAGEVEMQIVDGLPIDDEHFPDMAFQAFLLHQDYGEDGVLTDEELSGINALRMKSMYIEDMTGIENFFALDTLECAYNYITTLDLKANTQLRYLDCSYNSLTSLNVSQNRRLTYINCSENRLSELNVTKNVLLERLDCSLNLLASLTLEGIPWLTQLDCSYNLLNELDVYYLPRLTYLSCYYNSLTKIVGLSQLKSNHPTSDVPLKPLAVSDFVRLRPQVLPM